MAPTASTGAPFRDLGADTEQLLKWLYVSPYRMVKLFKATPTPQQTAVLDLIEHEHRIPVHARKRRVVMCTGQGVGKTALEVWFEWWRTLRRVDNLTIHTAPTGRQCRDVFLAENRVQASKGEPILNRIANIQHDRIKFFNRPQWEILTVTSQDKTNTAGFHRDGLTAVVDEFGNVDKKVAETFKGTLSNADSYFLGAGNPNDRFGPMYEVVHGPESNEWYRFVFSSKDSPIVDQLNVERLIREYGWDSDFVRVRVRGLFSMGQPNAVLNPDRIREAMFLWEHRNSRINYNLDGYAYDVQIGIDFAAEGNHESVIAVRVGSQIEYYEKFSRWEPVDVVRRAFEVQRALGYLDHEVLYVPDANGMGAGVSGLFYEEGKNVFKFKAHRRSSRKDFKNMGTESWFVMRELLSEGGRIVIPHDEILRKQLEQRTYCVEDTSGKIAIVPKGKETKETNSSPDRADAVTMAFYDRAFAEVKMTSTKPENKKPIGLGYTDVLGGDTSYKKQTKRRRRAA